MLSVRYISECGRFLVSPLPVAGEGVRPVAYYNMSNQSN